MCKCTPNNRTPYCGKFGCEWPKPENTRPTAPQNAEALEKMVKALKMVVHNAAIRSGKKGKAWDGDFVIKECQSALTEYLAAQDGRCPDCGYTEEDKKLHGDHHLCPRAALNQPRTVKIDGLREAVEKLDKAGSWMSAALDDYENTCAECKADFGNALDAIETLRAQLAAQGATNEDAG